MVAKKRIPVRTRLEPKLLNEMFEIKEINASDALHFPNAFTAIASLANRFTAVPILQGDVMTEQRLLAEDAIPDLAHAIPPGKRAVSIAVSKVTGVGGFIQQGNYVDVIATFKLKNRETVSKIVLQDILVLAVGNMFQFDGSLASTPPAIAAAKVDLVTLAVTPEELERLMFLDSGVTFRLVLKNPKDKDNRVQTTGATEKAVLKGLGMEAEEGVADARAALPKPPENPAVNVVGSGSPPSSPAPTTPIEATPAMVAAGIDTSPTPTRPLVDDKVEIWYGSSDLRRELIRETYPLQTTNRPVPTSLPRPSLATTNRPAPQTVDIANPSGE
ncbi:MAG: Flp pilus assembly protein RcpC/CpaB [Candidatus Ozemobacter sibiricus]|uniref:Flp pilus assembly protein RcpC/CpaB n=1 Tax=Candidatus Ozemobacter sibiricus TaxID=2268124 RepID=A0A367ZPM0_9BACT|nr:MAG: Flp pilus assembly protein RcpC/CpaB [Candidatus Ozemobacter sibiricus]